MYHVKYTFKGFNKRSLFFFSFTLILQKNQIIQTEHEKLEQTNDVLMKIEKTITETDLKKQQQENKELRYACNELIDEKNSLQFELQTAKTEIDHLRKEIKFLEEKVKTDITAELADLKTIINEKRSFDTNVVDDLSDKLKKSLEKINELETKQLTYDKNMISSKLEKEKLLILLKSRENQMNDMQKELMGIQGIVHEQLSTINSEMIMKSSNLIPPTPQQNQQQQYRMEMAERDRNHDISIEFLTLNSCNNNEKKITKFGRKDVNNDDDVMKYDDFKAILGE